MGMLLGTGKTAGTNFSELTKVYLTEHEAKRLMEEAIKYMGEMGWIDRRKTKGWKMVYDYQPLQRWGLCRRRLKTIIIHESGMNVATVLHEVAHIKFFDHSPGFKNIEKNLFYAWIEKKLDLAKSFC